MTLAHPGMKPRIHRDAGSGIWFCTGWLAFGVGKSPAGAYEAYLGNVGTVHRRIKGLA